MPGLKRSPGLADIDVCAGAHRAGYGALEDAFRKAKPAYSEVQRNGSVDYRRFSQPAPRSVPATYAEIPSDNDAASEADVHEGYENRIASPRHPDFIDLDDSGLPPTPPTLTNSDVAEPKRDSDLSPPALFADGVRNALESKKSGLSATPVQQLSPPTPDPSPPATTEDLPATRNAQEMETAPAMEQREKPQFLHPLIARSAANHALSPQPSSRAESFQTAQEDQTLSEKATTSQVHLPEDDTLPQHWLDSTRALRIATIGLGDITATETPKVETRGLQSPSTPKSSKRRSKHESPPQTAREDSDWEKHISYVSGPDELDGYYASAEEKKQPVNGLGLSGTGLAQSELERSAEDVNNMVYKRIQEDNVKRHSAISANSGALTVGVIVPGLDSTPRRLSRKVKCSSLRGDNSSEGFPLAFPGPPSPDLSSKEARLRERIKQIGYRRDSLDMEYRIRKVSSPARLGPDSSDMTALTLASMQESPTPRRSSRLAGIDRTREPIPDWVEEPVYEPRPVPESLQMSEWRRAHLQEATEWKERLFKPVSKPASNPVSKPASKSQPTREPKLRHFSYGDRLSKNMSVRRTSLEVSPPLPHNEFKILREPEYPTRSASGRNRDRVVHNMAVKRSSTEGAKISRAPGLPSNSARVRNPVLGVIPSVTSDAEESSSPNSRLRRFSREERLENNDQVRRTSLDHSAQSPPQYSESRPRSLLQDKGVLPSSPRKSLDARYLHPTTTPLSTSQFSDRTENIELCEASGVMLYPHNNDSLLVVQHGSRPVSKGKDIPDLIRERPNGLGKPIFAAQVDPPTPVLHASKPYQLDSPLTNPRRAPEPPVFQVIPPTPNEELERELNVDDQRNGTLRPEVNLQQRRLSILQRARRYSDSLFARTGSLRRPKCVQNSVDEKDTYLSPFWRPHGFWDGIDDSDEDDLDYEAAGSLPRGGDTSNVGDNEERRRGSVLPRAMSKRLPGFRGTGGFLVGNSLDLARHGTNNRRPYVSTGYRTLSKRASQELVKERSSNSPHQASQESLRRIANARRTFVVPFTGGRRPQFIGPKRFRARIKALRVAKEERARQERNQRLRGSIGYPVYQDSSR